jgi:hypothetical protein
LERRGSPHLLELRHLLRDPQGRLSHRTTRVIQAQVAAAQELQIDLDAFQCSGGPGSPERGFKRDVGAALAQRSVRDHGIDRGPGGIDRRLHVGEVHKMRERIGHGRDTTDPKAPLRRRGSARNGVTTW